MISKEIPGMKRDKLRRMIRYSVAFVSVIVLLILGVQGYKFYRLSPDRLFNENYIPYKLIHTDSSSNAIEAAYDEKKFREVIRLNAISVLSAKDIFLTGLAYLETGDDSRAISSFRIALIDIKMARQKKMQEIVEYYLALAYLRNRDFDQAIELMTGIHENPSHLYRDKFTSSYISQVKKLKWR